MKHLVEYASNPVDISFEINLSIALESFWSDIERCPYEGLSKLIGVIQLDTQPKVY